MAEPLKSPPAPGDPGPSTGNKVVEMVELTCYVCTRRTYLQNVPEYKPFGNDRTKTQCTWCCGDTRITASYHMEPLWAINW
jgi:hypothetical protein